MAPSLPACETDVSRVEQILVNLLGNAIQHTPEGTSVRLDVSSRDGFVVFTVRDQGPGVPATELEQIFDIYATEKEGDMRGVGLGLPLSRRLARLLGGDLVAVATEGAGGEFRLQLPAAPQS
jgi:two-component system sensor histidine kinase HydH